MSYSAANNGGWESNHPDVDNFLIDSDDEAGLIEPDKPIESSTPSETNAGPSSSYQSGAPPAYSLDSQFAAATGGQVETRRFMGGDTLDEPITTTLLRDIKAVGFRLKQVIWYTPASSLRDTHPGILPVAITNNLEAESPYTNQEWDMWGPLIFCLLIALTLSMIAPNHQASQVFSGIFVLIWLGQALVTLNIRLLGGTISFFYALSTTGYCLFPLVIAALLSSFVKLFLVRIIVDFIMIGWAIYSATRGLSDNGVLPSRVFLAMFPVGLFYTGLGWLCVIT